MLHEKGSTAVEFIALRAKFPHFNLQAAHLLVVQTHTPHNAVSALQSVPNTLRLEQVFSSWEEGYVILGICHSWSVLGLGHLYMNTSVNCVLLASIPVLLGLCFHLENVLHDWSFYGHNYRQRGFLGREHKICSTWWFFPQDPEMIVLGYGIYNGTHS